MADRGWAVVDISVNYGRRAEPLDTRAAYDAAYQTHLLTISVYAYGTPPIRLNPPGCTHLVYLAPRGVDTASKSTTKTNARDGSRGRGRQRPPT